MLMHIIAIALACIITTGDPVKLPKPSEDTKAWDSLDFGNKSIIAKHAGRFFLDDSGNLWCSNVPWEDHPQSWYCLDTQARFDPFERGFDWINVNAKLNARAVSIRMDYLEDLGSEVFTHFVVTKLPDESWKTYIGDLISRNGKRSRVHITVPLNSGNPVSKGDVLYFDYEVVLDGNYAHSWWEDGEKHAELLNSYKVKIDPDLDAVCPLRPLSGDAFPSLSAKQLAAELHQRNLKSLPSMELDAIGLEWVVKQIDIDWGH